MVPLGAGIEPELGGGENERERLPSFDELSTAAERDDSEWVEAEARNADRKIRNREIRPIQCLLESAG